MDDYDRQRVARAISQFLRWKTADAVDFVRSWRIHEVDDAAEHLRLVRDASVALAAIVYAVRMRLAGRSTTLQRDAALEAGQHAKVIQISPSDHASHLPSPKPRRVYRDPVFELGEE